MRRAGRSGTEGMGTVHFTEPLFMAGAAVAYFVPIDYNLSESDWKPRENPEEKFGLDIDNGGEYWYDITNRIGMNERSKRSV